mgnify:CR=1 FL=1
MKEVEAKPICPDCGSVMFKKTYHSISMSDGMTGWSCPECFTTRWDYDGQGNIGETQ